MIPYSIFKKLLGGLGRPGPDVRLRCQCGFLQRTYNLPLTFISISISTYHMQLRHDISAYGCIGLGGNEGEDDIYIQLFISKRPGDQ